MFFEEKKCGKIVLTKEHAKPLYVSPGTMISVDLAAELVKKCVVPPHKLPEPLHQAHRHAQKMLERFTQPKPNQEQETEENKEEMLGHISNSDLGSSEQ